MTTVTSTVKVLVRQPQAYIQFHPESQIIDMVFTARMNETEFIGINKALLDEFKKLNCNKLLVDALNMGVVSPGGQKWVVENLVPGMIAHLKGRKLYHAQIIPEKDIFGKFAAKNIEDRASKVPGMVMIAFPSEAEGRAWLQAQPNQ